MNVEDRVARFVDPVLHESSDVSAKVNLIFFHSFSKSSVQVFGESVFVFPKKYSFLITLIVFKNGNFKSRLPS